MAPLSSMTGFARVEGHGDKFSWVWELRSVNGRGLDLRFRLPPGWDSIEPSLRESASRALKRGHVVASLAVSQDEGPHLIVDCQALEQVLSLALELRARIPGSAPPRPENLLALPGVLRPGTPANLEPRAETVISTVGAGFEAALQELGVNRRGEGARLGAQLADVLAEIARLFA